MLTSLPGQSISDAIRDTSVPVTIYIILQFVSPFLLFGGVIILVISVFLSKQSGTLVRSEAAGAYNPKFDPLQKKIKINQWHKLQYVAMAMLILGLFPWIIKVLIISPPGI